NPDLITFVEAIKARPAILTEWQVVIAPHHIDAENIAMFKSILEQAGVNVAQFSRGGSAASASGGGRARIMLLDTMGMLAEAYQQATAAFVGGASHHQVHNVLEPAVHGLALA